MTKEQLIAQDAIFELSVVRATLEQMHALFEAVKPHLGEHSGARRLVELGIFTPESIASNADSAEEALEARLRETSAPQNAEQPNRGAAGEGDQ